MFIFLTVYHWVEMRTKMQIMGFRGATIKPLNEDLAAELGAELLGEAIIFLIGTGCMVLEYSRQAANSRRKEEELTETITSLQTQLAELSLTTETMDARLREFNRQLVSIPTPNKWLNKSFARYNGTFCCSVCEGIIAPTYYSHVYNLRQPSFTHCPINP